VAAVVAFGQNRLILKAETRGRLVPEEEPEIAITADDGLADSLHSGGMSLVSRTALRLGALTSPSRRACPPALGSSCGQPCAARC
jgi:hypothetical protein